MLVAVSDPMAVEVLDKLRFILNRDIKVAIAPVDAIQTAINRHYGQSETESVDSMLQEFTETAIDFTETEAAEAMVAEDDESAPVIKLVNLVMSEAVNMRASDIHVEPFEDRVRIRYRIDGELIERDSPPRRLLGRHRLPYQDHGPDGHRGKTASSGRPDQDPHCWTRIRHAGQYFADPPRPGDRPADSGPGEHPYRYPESGV